MRTYQIVRTVTPRYPFVLTIVKKKPSLHVTGYIDLFFLIEKINSSLRFVLHNCQRNGESSKCHAQVFSATWLKAIR